MKKILFISPLLLAIAASAGISLNHQKVNEVKAASAPVLGSLSSKQDIDLKDNSDEEIRNYYSALESLSEFERTGDCPEVNWELGDIDFGSVIALDVRSHGTANCCVCGTLACVCTKIVNTIFCSGCMTVSCKE